MSDLPEERDQVFMEYSAQHEAVFGKLARRLQLFQEQFAVFVQQAKELGNLGCFLGAILGCF